MPKITEQFYAELFREEIIKSKKNIETKIANVINQGWEDIPEITTYEIEYPSE